jgi:hypothetical protein
MGKLVLTSQGEPPYEAPAAQGAIAHAVGGLVVVTVSAVVPDRGIAPVPIEIPMTVETAKFLAVQLTDAIEEAERA